MHALYTRVCLRMHGIQANACWGSRFIFFIFDHCLFMVCGPSSRVASSASSSDLSSWMRCTVAFSVGYFVSDTILILMDKEVCLSHTHTRMYIYYNLYIVEQISFDTDRSLFDFSATICPL